MEYIRDLSQISKDDVHLAGGKGAALGEMMKAGIPVPPGFVVLTAAFEAFDEGKIPDAVVDEINTAFEKLGALSVAVRSSATVEDSADAAWAGQLETYLYTTKELLLENIEKCWNSLSSPRAVAYRSEKGLENKNISVAVVVQKMVESEMSGVAFSVHPVTQDPNTIIIEAGMGLGEALVSGEMTPDSYVIEKDSQKIIERRIQKERVLSDKQIQEVANMVARIEKHFGFPVDVEWAYEKGELWVLQSRPITTLSDQILVREFNKFFTREIPLIVMEYWQAGESQGLLRLLNGTTHFNPLFMKMGSGLTEVYYDTNNPETALQPLFGFVSNFPNEFIRFGNEFEEYQRKLQELVSDSGGASFQDLFSTMTAAWAYLPIWVQVGNADQNKFPAGFCERAVLLRDAFQKLEYQVGDLLCKYIAKKYPALSEYADVISFEESSMGKVPGREELEARKNGFIYFEGRLIHETLESFQKSFQIKVVQESYEDEIVSIGGRPTDVFFASLRIMAWTDELQKEIGASYTWIVINSDGEIFVHQAEDDRIRRTLAGKDMKDLRDCIRKIYDLKTQLLQNIRSPALIDGLGKMFTYFLIAKIIAEEIYERLSGEEQDEINRWRDDDPIFDVVSVFYEAAPSFSPSSFLHPQMMTAEEAKKVLVGDGINVDTSGREGGWSISYRNAALEVSSQKFVLANSDIDAQEVRGASAFPGKVKGKVVLVLRKEDLLKIQVGDIIVAPMTAPDYMAVMGKAAAFITDEGGITSHAAIVARELKKPCIVGTKNATKVLKDGDIIVVDAGQGLVTVVSR